MVTLKSASAHRASTGGGASHVALSTQENSNNTNHYNSNKRNSKVIRNFRFTGGLQGCRAVNAREKRHRREHDPSVHLFTPQRSQSSPEKRSEASLEPVPVKAPMSELREQAPGTFKRVIRQGDVEVVFGADGLPDRTTVKHALKFDEPSLPKTTGRLRYKTQTATKVLRGKVIAAAPTEEGRVKQLVRNVKLQKLLLGKRTTGVKKHNTGLQFTMKYN